MPGFAGADLSSIVSKWRGGEGPKPSVNSWENERFLTGNKSIGDSKSAWGMWPQPGYPVYEHLEVSERRVTCCEPRCQCISSRAFDSNLLRLILPVWRGTARCLYYTKLTPKLSRTPDHGLLRYCGLEPHEANLLVSVLHSMVKELFHITAADFATTL